MEWVYDRTQADVERVKVLNDKYAAAYDPVATCSPALGWTD